jgi:hypothetical protein
MVRLSLVTTKASLISSCSSAIIATAQPNSMPFTLWNSMLTYATARLKLVSRLYLVC